MKNRKPWRKVNITFVPKTKNNKTEKLKSIDIFNLFLRLYGEYYLQKMWSKIVVINIYLISCVHSLKCVFFCIYWCAAFSNHTQWYVPSSFTVDAFSHKLWFSFFFRVLFCYRLYVFVRRLQLRVQILQIVCFKDHNICIISLMQLLFSQITIKRV